MYNDKLVYEVVIWVFGGISLWTEKEPLTENLQTFIIDPPSPTTVSLVRENMDNFGWPLNQQALEILTLHTCMWHF